MKLIRFACRGALMAALAAFANPGMAVEPVHFEVRNNADLVALCSARPHEANYVAAINFCHGFGVGTYRMVEIEEAASRSKHKKLCASQAATTRDQAIAGFVTWASDKPKTMNSPPSDGFSEYLYATFPCKK